MKIEDLHPLIQQRIKQYCVAIGQTYRTTPFEYIRSIEPYSNTQKAVEVTAEVVGGKEVVKFHVNIENGSLLGIHPINFEDFPKVVPDMSAREEVILMQALDTYRRPFAEFRRDIRTLLSNHGVDTNPAFTDENIVDALTALLDKKCLHKAEPV